jgi:predicted ATPase
LLQCAAESPRATTWATSSFMTLLQTALAEAEAEAGEIEEALASIDHAVALTERTGQRRNEADTHRARGEILLKRDPANTVPTEEAFLTAIAVAQQQKAKSFELRAATSIAVESAPRAYRLKASNAAPPFSTSAGTSAGRRVSVHWFAGVLQSLCSPS